ncbi:MAG: glycosyltransferase [Acidobacteriales bacterium]|nr:glycosyltransferase [Terriglobales bacterium]
MICTTIIPTINRPTLERTVKSVLDQGLDPTQHEILIFNNSDKQLPEANWLRSPKIRIIESHSNVIDASNRGGAMARGKYVNFLHDDDYLLPNALNGLLALAESSGCSWVYGAYELVDDTTNAVSLVPARTRGNMFAWFISGEGIHFACSVIRRDVFLRAGGLDATLIVSPDSGLMCQVALLGNFECTSQVVAVVRRSGGSGTSMRFDRIKQDHWKLREKALDSPLASRRMWDSIGHHVVLRQRACRVYLASSVRNMLSGRLRVAAGRFVTFVRLAGSCVYVWSFWRGVIRRPQTGVDA